MCGIAGYVLDLGLPNDVRENLEAKILPAMARHLAHRGPDGQGLYTADGLGLCHTRLAIIDLAGGNQPLFSADRRLILVANGEIYNHVELRRALERLGYRFATRSDSETILHAYAAWGEACLERLQGMFAFALYDASRKTLLLVRDRLGIKPLYYTRTAYGWAFASEIKGLLPWLKTRQVRADALAGFMETNFCAAPATLLAGVFKLPPGYLARIGADGQCTVERYWTPLALEPLDIDFDEAARRFDALISEVITIHLRSDVPFGLFLSGGVDSSILAALIAHHIDAPLKTWSVGFPRTSVHNELDAAAWVASRLNTEHSVLEIDADTIFARLPHAIWAADDLTGDYACLPTSLLAQQAGQALKVVFSGEGGDEVFAGYGRYRVPRWKRWLAAWRRPGSGGFRTRGLLDRAPEDVCGPKLHPLLPSWRNPFIAAWRETPARWSDLMRRQYVDMVTWLPDDLLIKVDRMLMAWGVEGRVPFLDHRIVEFGLALPDRLKIGPRGGKHFLRAWGERLLPGEHLWARKRGFTVPVGEWLQGERLKRYAQSVLTNTGVRQWFRPDALQRMVAAHARHGRMAGPLWALLCFALWHRIYIEGDGSMPNPQQDPFDYLEQPLTTH